MWGFIICALYQILIFSFRPRVQTGSGVHPASYPKGTDGSFSVDKARGA